MGGVPTRVADVLVRSTGFQGSSFEGALAVGDAIACKVLPDGGHVCTFAQEEAGGPDETYSSALLGVLVQCIDVSAVLERGALSSC